MRYTSRKIIQCLRLVKRRYILQKISTKCQRFFRVIFRSSRPEVFFKRGVLENFAKFTGNSPYWSLFLIKSSSPQLYLKKETPAQAFSYELCEIFKNASGRLLVFFSSSREISHYAFLFCRIL